MQSLYGCPCLRTLGVMWFDKTNVFIINFKQNKCAELDKYGSVQKSEELISIIHFSGNQNFGTLFVTSGLTEYLRLSSVSQRSICQNQHDLNLYHEQGKPQGIKPDGALTGLSLCSL